VRAASEIVQSNPENIRPLAVNAARLPITRKASHQSLDVNAAQPSAEASAVLTCQQAAG